MRQLVDAFVDELSGDLRAGCPDVAELERDLETAFGEASVAWPGVDIEPQRFARDLARRVNGHLPSQQRVDLGTWFGSDVYLAIALGAGDRAALKILEHDLLPELARIVRRRGLDDGLLDDLLQRIRQSLLVADGDKPAKIGEFGDGGLCARSSW